MPCNDGVLKEYQLNGLPVGQPTLFYVVCHRFITPVALANLWKVFLARYRSVCSTEASHEKAAVTAEITPFATWDKLN
jgi:hypothetical protein